MKNVKKSFRKTELFLLFSLFPLSIILTVIMQYSGHYEWEGLLGYFIGIVLFIFTSECLFLINFNSKASRLGFILFTNLKLVFIGGLFYIIKLTGIPAINLVIGFLSCQILAAFALLINARCSINNLKASAVTTLTSINK